MNQKHIIALELSGSQIKMAEANVDASAISPIVIPCVEAIATEDKTKSVQYGRVINVKDAAQEVSLVKQKLENNPKLQGGKIERAYVGLSGRSLCSVQTTAELVLPSEMEITEEIVRKLCHEATKSIPAEKKVLKVLPRRYAVDAQVTQTPIGLLGTKFKGEFTVVVCSPANRKNLEMVVTERAQIDVVEYVVTPLAIADMVLGEEEKQLGCALVDIGAQTTSISIYKDRSLQYLATLPLGSHNITLDIAMGMKFTEERAEYDKCTIGDAMPESNAPANEASSLINCYVQARTGEIIANLMAQIGFAGYKSTDLTAGFIIVGRGAKLKNFKQLLESQSKMQVRRATVTSTITVNIKDLDPADYVSLFAILLRAARRADVVNCVAMPQLEPADREELEDYTYPASTESHDDPNDLLWDQDDDEISRRRIEQLRDEERRRERERAKEEKEEKERQERERKKFEKEERDREKAEARSKQPSLLKRMRDKMEKILSYDPEDDDTPLEDN